MNSIGKLCMAMAAGLSFISYSGFAAPNGAVLILNGKHLKSTTITATAGHKYFGELEGPAWENKYNAMRYYADNGNRNSVDIVGKYKYDPILHYADSANFELHADHTWGGDIFKAGNCRGLGGFNLFDNGTWINPALGENLDSMTITVKDSSVQTPSIIVKYWGLSVNGSKNNLEWTIATKQDIRPTYCDLTITGNYSGKVVVCLRKYVNAGVTLVKDPNKALLATLGKQAGIVETYTDSCLLAVYADKKYFSSFSDDSINYGMVLTPDANKKVQWAMAYNWAKEPLQIYNGTKWQDTLFTTPTAIAVPAMKTKISGDKNLSEFRVEKAFDLNGKCVSLQPLSRNAIMRNGVYIFEYLDKTGQKRITSYVLHSK